MKKSALHNTLLTLTPLQWRTLRTLGWAACFAQGLVLWRGQSPETRVFDLLLLGCYLVATTAITTGQSKAARAREEDPEGADRDSFSRIQRIAFRALILVSVGLFFVGASQDTGLLVSPGMVALFFMAAFLWVVTARPAAGDSAPAAEEPLPAPSKAG